MTNPSGNACRGWDRWAKGEIRKIHPVAIVIGQSYSEYLLDGNPADTARVEASLRQEILALRRLTPTVVLIQDPPALPINPVDCLLGHNATFGSCTYPEGDTLTSDGAEIATITGHAGAKLLPTLQWFCASGQCPTVIDDTIAYLDQAHISNTYATQLQPAFAAELGRLIGTP